MNEPSAHPLRHLHLLCAGAAQGVVLALKPGFEARTGCTLHCRFGAVGAMKEALLAGEPCDVMVLTQALIDSLCADGLLRADSCAALGPVLTGVAVRAGTPPPRINSAQDLSTALLAADAVYFPDPLRATAGIHFAAVMKTLGVWETLQPRLHSYPAGAIAMRELAASQAAHPIGCTQVSEILYTPGVALVGVLPQEFELGTVYTAAVTAVRPPAADSDHSHQAALASLWVACLTGEDSVALRRQAGFVV